MLGLGSAVVPESGVNIMPAIGMATGPHFGNTQNKIIRDIASSNQKQNGLIIHPEHVGRHFVRGAEDTNAPTNSNKTSEAAVQTNEVSELTSKISLEIAKDIVQFVTRTKKSQPPHKYARTMRRTVEEISERHSILFGSMVNKLQVTESTVQTTFHSVFDEIFNDGQKNWGRVVAVYAFGSRLALYCFQNGMSHGLLDNISTFVGEYVTSEIGAWIDENGGWDGFCDYFPEKETLEDKVWKGIWYTACGLGAGALATFMAAKS